MDVINSPSEVISITFVAGPLTGKTYQINKPITTIGRDPANDISIADPVLSRRHAQLIWKNGTWSIEKLSLANTVSLNQQDVQQASLANGDTIGLGPATSFLFLSSADEVKPSSPLSGELAHLASATQVSSPPLATGQLIGEAKTQRAAPPSITDDSGETASVPSFEISSNIDRVKQTYPLTKSVINIGRDPSNDIVINEAVVSAFHAQIIREDKQLMLVHPHPARAKTLNGLLYQGRQIAGDAQFRKVLSRGDIFRIGDEHGTLVTLDFNDGSGISQDIVPEIRPIPLGAPVISIGRLAENTVVLNHPQVSGQHARLEQVQGGYRIVDLGSTNHVYVNAERVTNQLLKPGDEVRIGPYKLTYTGTQLTQSDESSSIRIDALGLKKVGTKQTILINEISIAIPPRKFVALVLVNPRSWMPLTVSDRHRRGLSSIMDRTTTVISRHSVRNWATYHRMILSTAT